MSSMSHRAAVLVLFMSSTVYANPYFLYTKSSWDFMIAATTYPGMDFTRTNLLRMVTHNALLDAFFSHQPLKPSVKLALYKEKAREDLQHVLLLDLFKAVSLVKDVHSVMLDTYDSKDVDKTLLRVDEISVINELLHKPLVEIEEMRLSMIDFLLAKTAEDEKGSNFLSSILYAIVATAMPTAVRNSKLGSSFVSTTDTWIMRDKHGKPITDLGEEDIDRDTLWLPPPELDAVLTHAAQALEFVIARHAEAAQDSYWVGVEETERQDYLAFASQHLPDQQQALAKIKKIQAITDAMQQREEAAEFLFGYVATSD